MQLFCATIILLALGTLAQNSSPDLGDQAGNFAAAGEEECSGNRLEALEIGRQCSRKCRRDVACENARKQCLCDGLCGMSCIKPDLVCPELARPENGDYAPKLRLFNAKVGFSCADGFYLFGSRERICQGDEEWSGSQPECLRQAGCGNPPKINHAKNPTDGSYALNDKVSYACYPGYQSRGSREAVCRLLEGLNQTAWLWAGGAGSRKPTRGDFWEQQPEAFRCIPRSCGDPGQIENGRRQGEAFIIASSVLYACNEGFQMIGQARRYCQSDSQWSGQAPQCEPISCSPTEHLENGKINYNYPLVYNSTVEYACDYGFRLVGAQQRRCGPEGRLVGESARCEEIDCGELGPLHNGHVKGYSNRMGDKKFFQCAEGTTFEGSEREASCLESGLWSSSLPRCLAPCRVPRVDSAASLHLIPGELLLEQQQAGSSSSPPPLPARAAEELLPGASVPHGSYLEVVCARNFELDDELVDNRLLAEPARCNNSTWSYLPKCKPAKCRQAPPAPRNGRVRVLSIEHGSRGHLHCLDGFKLIGEPASIECRQGNWSSSPASCQEIYCTYPGQIEHGRVLLIGLTGMYDYKPYIKRMPNNRQVAYECDPGFRPSDGAPTGATCMDGVWRPEGLPSCIKE